MMKTKLIYSFLTLSVIFMLSGCEKKYQRPDEYKIDLFKGENQENHAYVMSEDEAYDESVIVLGTSNIKLVDSSAGRGNTIFIYKIDSSEILKSEKDSLLSFPMEIIATQRLKIKKNPQDSLYVFLQKLKGYRFIAAEKNIKYQWLKNAPVYPLPSANNQEK
ncbi:hypothetical protein [Chryseobacterium sp.]|uniref:hypothetical protein n=1 Tax=Chryseobacterium sp. TaxID=1871047 RepID=UPI0025C5DE54|nr:hypothetical protein [Chryseobacterium sp.]